MKRRGNTGFTFVELLMALWIGSVVGLVLTKEIVQAYHAHRTGVRWMRATQLAAQGIERLRAGDENLDDDTGDGFTVSWEARTGKGYRDLERVSVTVVWMDEGERRFTLDALIPGVR